LVTGSASNRFHDSFSLILNRPFGSVAMYFSWSILSRSAIHFGVKNLGPANGKTDQQWQLKLKTNITVVEFVGIDEACECANRRWSFSFGRLMTTWCGAPPLIGVNWNKCRHSTDSPEVTFHSESNS
jgi:hypothetical protein